MVTWIIYTVYIIVMHYGVVRNSVWCSDCFGVILYLFISCCFMEIKGGSLLEFLGHVTTGATLIGHSPRQHHRTQPSHHTGNDYHFKSCIKS